MANIEHREQIDAAELAEREVRAAPERVVSDARGTRDRGLEVGSADDPAEREADRLADRAMSVMRTLQHAGGAGGAADRVRRGAGVPVTASSESGQRVRRRADRGSAGSAAGGQLDDHTTTRIDRARGGGATLDDDLRPRLEGAFGSRLESVRVHTGPEAADLSASISAKAFTTGSDIFFGRGQYQPGSSTGRRLIAHEVAHTLQNGGRVGREIHRQPDDAALAGDVDRAIKRHEFEVALDVTTRQLRSLVGHLPVVQALASQAITDPTALGPLLGAKTTALALIGVLRSNHASLNSAWSRFKPFTSSHPAVGALAPFEHALDALASQLDSWAQLVVGTGPGGMGSIVIVHGEAITAQALIGTLAMAGPMAAGSGSGTPPPTQYSSLAAFGSRGDQPDQAAGDASPYTPLGPATAGGTGAAPSTTDPSEYTSLYQPLGPATDGDAGGTASPTPAPDESASLYTPFRPPTASAGGTASPTPAPDESASLYTPFRSPTASAGGTASPTPAPDESASLYTPFRSPTASAGARGGSGGLVGQALRPDAPPARVPRRYPFTKAKRATYEGEEIDGSTDLPGIIESGRRAVAAGTEPSIDDFMIRYFGWSQADVDKYITGNEKATVKYLDETEREDFEVHGGSSLTQGPERLPLDTTNMFSKHSGMGWGIYVMAPDGSIYVDQHKVGLFHHSSFLAGASVAGAGEIMVLNGTLRGITNKTGHYQAGAAELKQVIEELKTRGASLAGVDTYVVSAWDRHGTKIEGGAEDFIKPIAYD